MTDTKIKITKIPLCLTVKCKCGEIVAASLLWGGISIDEEFTDTIAEIYNNGGKIEIINTEKESVSLGGCKCKLIKP